MMHLLVPVLLAFQTASPTADAVAQAKVKVNRLVDAVDKGGVEWILLKAQLISGGEPMVIAIRAVQAERIERDGPTLDRLRARRAELRPMIPDLIGTGDTKEAKEYREVGEQLGRLAKPLQVLRELEVDTHREWCWKKGEPSLLTALSAWESFLHFARKENWKAAARCFAAGDDADAKRLYEGIKDLLPELGGMILGHEEEKTILSLQGTGPAERCVTRVVVSYTTLPEGLFHIVEIRLV